MRVLQVINSLGTGGAEKLILDVIPKYNSLGLQVDVLLLWNNDHIFTQQLINSNCCKVFILNNSTNIKDIYKASNVFGIRRIMRDYDIVHVHLFPAQYLVGLANLGLGKKLIFTEHSTTNNRMSSKVLSMIDKYSYKFFTRIVSISDDVTKVLNKYLKDKSKIFQIENGVDLNRIANAGSYKKSEISSDIFENDILIAQVSAFRKGKDQKTVVKALKYLPDNYKLLLIGDGSEDEKNSVKLLVKELSLEKRVLLLGNRSDVPSLIKSTDINVLSSEFEGLSLSSVEGLASGKPFIASKVPGLVDVVEGAGILFELGNEKQLASIIAELMNNRNYYNQTVLSSQERAKRYDINVMVDHHIKLYERVYA